MKIVNPKINYVFDTDTDKINTLVIENQRLMFDLLTDIEQQLSGYDGKTVLSDNNKILSISKQLELLTQFIPFEINRKNLISKISAELEKNAVCSEKYEHTAELLRMLEEYLSDLAFDLRADINFSKINIGAIIKAASPEILDDYDSLSEKIIDYMELVTDFDRQKLFITVNLRNYVTDEETESFMRTVLSHRLHILMIESHEYFRLPSENRVVIDCDLCEIF